MHQSRLNKVIWILTLLTVYDPAVSILADEAKQMKLDLAVLRVAEEVLHSGVSVQPPRASTVLLKELPAPMQRYHLALICWSLMRPEGVDETDRAKMLEREFWACVRSLSQEGDKMLVLKLIDDCQMQSGELLRALEFLYQNDPNGLREELHRHGIKG